MTSAALVVTAAMRWDVITKHWDAVGAVGQYVAAAVTLVAVVVALLGLRDAREAAARATAELKQDRELAWAPYLVITREVITTKNVLGTYEGDCYLKNVGRGPAINCRVAYFEFRRRPPQVNIWLSGLPVDLGAGDTAVVRLSEVNRQQAYLILDSVTQGDEGCATVCRDRFGNALRFVKGQAKAEVRTPSDPPLLWTHTLVENYR
jgi:hypothetical protein